MDLNNEFKARMAPAAICSHCGQAGAHFVPPSFGEEGFYYCERSRPRAVRA